MTEDTREETDGTGTRDYDAQGFSKVDLSTAIEYAVTQSAQYSVKAAGPERLTKRLKVEVDGETLKVRLGSGVSFLSGFRSNGSLKVSITMPRLKELTVSGACRGTVSGFKSGEDLEMELSGASQADIDLEAGKTELSVSGAGRLKGVLKAQEAVLELSGASRCDLSGSGGDMHLDASGASHADLSKFKVQNADIDLSGASTASVSMDGRLDADLSGASKLEYTGNVTLGRTSSTGASRLRGNDE